MNARIVRSLGLSAGLLLFTFAVCASDALPDANTLAYTTRKSKQPAPPTVSSVALWGTIESIQSDGSGLKIKAGTSAKAKSQKEWVVVPTTETEVTIEGAANFDYLQKGKLVEFTGEVINNDHVDGKIKALTVVDKKTSLSTSTSKKGPKDHAADTGIGGRIAAPKEDADAPAAGSTGKSDGKAATDTVATKKTITGKIVVQEDKKLTIASGSKLIKIELTDVPTIDVRLSDAKLVQAGAKIEVHGTGAQSKAGNQVAAKTIVVTLAEPLTGKKSASASATPKKVVGN